MAECRRLLIEPDRFLPSNLKTHTLILKDHEEHYLRRVLRLRNGDHVDIVDGIGSLWNAVLLENGLRCGYIL